MVKVETKNPSNFNEYMKLSRYTTSRASLWIIDWEFYENSEKFSYLRNTVDFVDSFFGLSLCYSNLADWVFYVRKHWNINEMIVIIIG